MAKKEFGGGLDALFNRTDKTQEQASTDEAPLFSKDIITYDPDSYGEKEY